MLILNAEPRAIANTNRIAVFINIIKSHRSKAQVFNRNKNYLFKGQDPNLLWV